MKEKNKPYYTAYENRYKSAYKAGAQRWGHSPDDEVLNNALTQWVLENHLAGRQVIEFACGEGASGVILAGLGCLYHGVDIAPSAVEKAKTALKDYPDARVTLGNMTLKQDFGSYDGALDVMGLHMLITDSDRANYLKNAYACLKNGAHMLFFRESYSVDAYEGQVASFDEWVHITGKDYETPQQRFIKNGEGEIEVYVPLLPARAKTREGYMREMEGAGFVVDDIQMMDTSNSIISSVSIYVHKHQE